MVRVLPSGARGSALYFILYYIGMRGDLQQGGALMGRSLNAAVREAQGGVRGGKGGTRAKAEGKEKEKRDCSSKYGR